MSDVIRVSTGSRLHLGLLSLPGNGPRGFGGVGLMIDEPRVVVSVTPSRDWSAEGPSSERALEFAKRVVLPGESLRVVVEQCPEPHTGLGTGTQLALATGAAVCRSRGESRDGVSLAALLGRGQRSGLGVHGFAAGGFLVDGGKGPATIVAPLVCRHPFPEEWRILLVTPRCLKGLAGEAERTAFAKLANQPCDVGQTEALCRLVLLEMVPALLERDLAAFGDAVFEFNRRAGLLFKSSQGGEYSSPEAAAIVANLRQRGVRGVGQSSWGPTIFAIGEEEQLTAIGRELIDVDVRVVRARNVGQETV